MREITLDMAPNMEHIARICFPAAKRVTDRFHVQKVAYKAVQEMRVKARWEALDEESPQLFTLTQFQPVFFETESIRIPPCKADKYFSLTTASLYLH